MANIIWEAGKPTTNKERRNGQQWEWPAAFYVGEMKKPAAFIVCTTEECSERGMNNGPVTGKLQVILMKYNAGPKKNPPPNDPYPDAHKMFVQDRFFDRIEHAMMWTQLYLEQHRDWQPLLV